MLESDAVYRIVGESPDGVVVEVVEVPGLKPGFRLTLTAEVVAGMAREEARECSSEAGTARAHRA